MKKHLDYIMKHWNLLTDAQWDFMTKNILDGLRGYPTITETILDDHLNEWKQTVLEAPYEETKELNKKRISEEDRTAQPQDRDYS